MDEVTLRQIIREEITKAETDSQFDTSPVSYHEHMGTDSPKLNPANFLGFPIIASAPVDKPVNGTIRLYDSGGTRKIYAFIAGVWYSATLT